MSRGINLLFTMVEPRNLPIWPPVLNRHTSLTQSFDDKKTDKKHEVVSMEVDDVVKENWYLGSKGLFRALLFNSRFSLGSAPNQHLFVSTTYAREQNSHSQRQCGNHHKMVTSLRLHTGLEILLPYITTGNLHNPDTKCVQTKLAKIIRQICYSRSAYQVHAGLDKSITEV